MATYMSTTHALDPTSARLQRNPYYLSRPLEVPYISEDSDFFALVPEVSLLLFLRSANRFLLLHIFSRGIASRPVQQMADLEVLLNIGGSQIFRQLPHLLHLHPLLSHPSELVSGAVICKCKLPMPIS